jgi:hypothetical protein
MRVLAIAILSTVAVAPASAQSLYGPGGLFLHPTASFPPQGRLTPAILVLPQHHPEARSTRTWISGSVDFGLTPDLELGASVVKVAGWQRDPSAGGFFKYRLRREGTLLPAVAVGYTHLGGGDVDTQVGFLALRKQLGVGKRRLVVAHLGVQYANRIDGEERKEFQPYGGLELGLTSRLTFAFEARPRGNNEFDAPMALTLSYRVADYWKVAVTWANNGLSDEPKFGFGAGFSLGARR